MKADVTMDTQERLFTIQEISKQLKISKPTLRFWEKALDGLLTTHRTSGGQRRYSCREVKVLQEIQRLKAEGMSLRGISWELKKRLKQQHIKSDSFPVDEIAARIAALVKAEISSFLDELKRGKEIDH